MIYFHGTNEKSAKVIAKSGFDIDSPRQSDPGDLGWGIYLTTDYNRAKSYGTVIFAVELSEKANLAEIINPYFIKRFERLLPQTAEELLFYNIAFNEKGNMRNVSQMTSTEEKIRISKQIRDTFLKASYDGIIAGPFNLRRDDKEIVIFNSDIIELVYTTKKE